MSSIIIIIIAVFFLLFILLGNFRVNTIKNIKRNKLLKNDKVSRVSFNGKEVASIETDTLEKLQKGEELSFDEREAIGRFFSVEFREPFVSNEKLSEKIARDITRKR